MVAIATVRLASSKQPRMKTTNHCRLQPNCLKASHTFLFHHLREIPFASSFTSVTITINYGVAQMHFLCALI
jgi:hypothetical protein